jgi:hypothetical protein
MPQQWQAPFTPRQRWIFFQLALAPEAQNIKTGAEGKAFRRALRAFGIVPIRDALGPGNKVADKMAESREPALFEITAENVEAALRWADIPRHPSLEMDGGEAFDVLEQLRADPNGWKAPSGVPAYNPASEDWRASATPEEIDELEALDLIALIAQYPPTPIIGWESSHQTQARALIERHRKRTAAPAP